MRPTKTDRRVLWGWVGGTGGVATVKGGNCAFGVARISAGAYSVVITEPDGLPQPCAVTLTPITSVASNVIAEHVSFPTKRTLNVQLRTAGAPADNDFYWTAIGT